MGAAPLRRGRPAALDVAVDRVRGPLRVLGVGPAAVLAAEVLDDAAVVGSTLRTSFDLPAIARAGIRYAQPGWDVELDFVYEMHSTFERIRTTPNDIAVTGVPGIGTIPILELDIPRNFVDTYSLRLGGDYELVDRSFTLRAGALYESSAIPSETLSVLQIDADKVGLCAGATWEASPSVSVDFGYTHLFFFETRVTNSIIEQLNPTNPEGNSVVGNGVYRTSFDMLGLGVRLHL